MRNITKMEKKKDFGLNGQKKERKHMRCISKMEMNYRKGWIRLGIVVLALLVLGFIIPFLKIYNFSAFNSGVSTIIGLIALVWLIYSVFSWVSDGFKNKGSPYV